MAQKVQTHVQHRNFESGYSSVKQYSRCFSVTLQIMILAKPLCLMLVVPTGSNSVLLFILLSLVAMDLCLQNV